MSDNRYGGERRRRRRDGGADYRERGQSGPQPFNRPMQRVWKCPSCGRTRPGAGADARAPLCRQDLSEMRIALVPGPFQRRQQFRGPRQYLGS
jgi:ribosomal protein L37AE/L43A